MDQKLGTLRNVSMANNIVQHNIPSKLVAFCLKVLQKHKELSALCNYYPKYGIVLTT